MRLAYRLPLLNACICLVALLGYVVPKLSFLMGGLLVLFWLDLPVSLVALFFSMGNRELLAILCLLVLGSLQWYVFGRGIENAIEKFRKKKQGAG
jgi:hypothetical protein